MTQIFEAIGNFFVSMLTSGWRLLELIYRTLVTKFTSMIAYLESGGLWYKKMVILGFIIGVGYYFYANILPSFLGPVNNLLNALGEFFIAFFRNAVNIIVLILISTIGLWLVTLDWNAIFRW